MMMVMTADSASDPWGWSQMLRDSCCGDLRNAAVKVYAAYCWAFSSENEAIGNVFRLLIHTTT